VEAFRPGTANSRIVGADKGLKLPRQPRFLDELVLVPLKDGVLVDGSEQQHVFKGPAAQTLLPRLISLMDGSRTLVQLEMAFPTNHPRQVQAAISMLFDYGLIEEGSSEDTAAAVSNRETLAFLRRYVSTTRANSSGQEAYGRLSASRVIIFHREGAGKQAQALECILERTGIGSVVSLARELLSAGFPAADFLSQPLVVSLSFEQEDCEWHEELDDWCAKNRHSWLRSVVDQSGGYVDLGPLFEREKAPCYRCFREVHSRITAPWKEPMEQRPSANPDFWTAMLAVEITYFLAGIGPLDTARDFQRYNLDSLHAQSLKCVRLPGCPHCRPLAETPNHCLVDTAVVFEDYVGLRSRPLLSYRVQRDRSLMSGTLARQAKSLPNCKHLALEREMPKLDRGALDMLRDGATDSGHRVALADLTMILLMTAGIRDLGTGKERVNRWAATAGNLGSVELFVMIREIEGLAPGLYFYDPREHSLAWLRRRRGALEAEDFVRRIMRTDSCEMPAALVLLTGAFQRVAQKYGPFGYRLINFDAGAALSQLHLVAKALNIRSQTVTRWNDGLLENQLNLRPFAEQSTAVAALFGGDRRAVTTVFACPAALAPPQIRVSGSAKPSHDFCEMPPDRVLEMLYRESRMNEKDIEGHVASDTRSSQVERPSVGPPERPQTIVSLPSPAVGGQVFSEVLARRRSIRHFSDEPLFLAQVGTMLHYGSLADTRDWPDDHRAGVFLTFFVLARQVADLNPAVYTYDASHHALFLARDLPPVDEAIELYVQDEFASAPVVLWIVGDLAAACTHQGACGHRSLLLRAGAAAHRCWMAALAMGLSGSLIAGLVPGAARRQLGLDGYKKSSLLAFAAGHECLTSLGKELPGWGISSRNGTEFPRG
jgi:SagB-type dehydrogenase family enzyme